MAFLESSDSNQEQIEAAVLNVATRKPMKYRQTMLFATTALVVMAIGATFAATKVNSTIAGVAEKQVIALAEENTTRGALHIQSMVVGGSSMIGMNDGNTMAMGTDGTMSVESDGNKEMDAGDAMTKGAEGSTAMNDDGTMSMESDGDTVMEAGRVMTNRSNGSTATGTDGSVKLMTTDSNDGTEAEFSHGICPDCEEKLYPGIYRKLQEKKLEIG